MMIVKCILVSLAAWFAAALCIAQTALTNDSIIKMVKAGLGDDVIITVIQAQPSKYSTSSVDLIVLKGAGVSDKIIKAMITKGGDTVVSPGPSPSTSTNESLGAPERGPEPEFSGTVYWLDRGSNKLNPLERQKVNMGAKVKAMGFGGVKSMTEIEGERSPVRFAAESKPEFIFQAAQYVDPQTLVQIFRFTVKKGHRELINLQSRGFMGLSGVHSGEADKVSISFQASKYNESSIRITPAMPLPRGEYAIQQLGREIFCFGVD